MLANVVDVDEAMQTTALEAEDGAAVFFDFAAAFPSISQDWIRRVVERCFCVDGLANLVLSFYYLPHVVNSLSMATFFVMSGIIQGCPVSGLLFDSALDPFLRFASHQVKLVPSAFKHPRHM